MQESILSHVQRIVKGEVSLAMKEQQAVVTSSIMQAMRSAAGTPVPSTHLDYQTQQANILQLLQQGQINQAFQQVGANTHTHTHNFSCSNDVRVTPDPNRVQVNPLKLRSSSPHRHCRPQT